MIPRPPRSTQSRSSAASDVYKRQEDGHHDGRRGRQEGDPQMTDSKAPKRTAAEIEAEIAQTRTDLTETVNALTDRLSPKNQLAGAKESAIAAADKLADKAAGFLSTAGETTVSFADDATEMARTLVDEVKVKAKSH